MRKRISRLRVLGLLCFMQEAVELVRPCSYELDLVDHVRQAVFNCLTSWTQDVEAVRKCVWKYWSKRAAALESEERALHSEAPEDVRPCLAGDKTLFLEEPCWAASKTSRPGLASSRWVKHAIVGKVAPGHGVTIDEAALQKTEAEVTRTFRHTRAGWSDWQAVGASPRVRLEAGESVRGLTASGVFAHNATSITVESHRLWEWSTRSLLGSRSWPMQVLSLVLGWFGR